ncbi:MAG: DNRLRE domain-containing protein [Patescibacteria group bacterium]
MSLAGLFAAIYVAAGAETISHLTEDWGAVMVTVASSEPPVTRTINTSKPKWVDSETSRPISGINNIWYSLSNRLAEPRIGGNGDQFEVFFRFPMSNAEFTNATLRVFLSKDKRDMPKKMEVYRVTTADPLPIKKAPGESWTAERMRFSMRPSSEYFTTVKPAEGWVDIDITALAKSWIKDPDSNHGLRFVSTEHRDQWVYLNGPRAEENHPLLVLLK